MASWLTDLPNLATKGEAQHYDITLAWISRGFYQRSRRDDECCNRARGTRHY